MSHDIISILLLSGMCYWIFAFNSKTANEKYLVEVPEIFKWIFGYFMFEGNSWSGI